MANEKPINITVSETALPPTKYEKLTALKITNVTQ